MKLAYIRALAEEYATKYNPKNQAPFPYENIVAEHQDLKVYFSELDDDVVSGVILLKDDEFSIIINTTKPATRQYFTLGHEFGHYFLHQDKLRAVQGIIDGDETLDGTNILYRSDEVSPEAKRLEIEANNFAASLLMPSDLVRRAWEATGTIEDCARIFQVSAIAMTVRLTTLGIVAE